jgi:spore cortex biosynthesis protein YabQ
MAQELRELASSLLLGGLLGGMLHFYQLALAQSRTSRFFVYALDILFWLMAVAMAFAALIPSNGGAFRLHILLLIAAGMGLYRLYFAKRLNRVFRPLAKPLGSLFTLVDYGLAWPLRLKNRKPPGEDGDDGGDALDGEARD